MHQLTSHVHLEETNGVNTLVSECYAPIRESRTWHHVLVILIIIPNTLECIYIYTQPQQSRCLICKYSPDYKWKFLQSRWRYIAPIKSTSYKEAITHKCTAYTKSLRGIPASHPVSPGPSVTVSGLETMVDAMKTFGPYTQVNLGMWLHPHQEHPWSSVVSLHQ